MINKSVRRMERERRKLLSTEKKYLAELKVLARQNNHVGFGSLLVRCKDPHKGPYSSQKAVRPIPPHAVPTEVHRFPSIHTTSANRGQCGLKRSDGDDDESERDDGREGNSGGDEAVREERGKDGSEHGSGNVGCKCRWKMLLTMANLILWEMLIKRMNNF
eukprot:TRINITY_DN3185_c0_g3_i5.p1 TRINITY_DN3185_c0_g3~~TRINITY_DN3185_c0_g3_i5.p1  ORF type:complete len:161 (+),score=6.78 TRINITY_DN3185_c0_g3_i5:314-796(+)